MGTSQPVARQHFGLRENIHAFFDHNAWIEGKSIDQLNDVSALPGVQQIAAFPDLHPGKYGPVGCAVLADRLYPALVGNDIGCGMSVFRLPIKAVKFRQDKAAAKLRSLEADGPLDTQGLGTIGGGNHFCEIQQVVWVDANDDTDLNEGDLLIFVHSGSRGMGGHIFRDVLQQGIQGFDPASDFGKRYLLRHNQAVAFASKNRWIVALRAASALGVRDPDAVVRIVDNTHNAVTQPLNSQGLWLHRKGAAEVENLAVPIAGSREADSFLVRSIGDGQHSLFSLPHGSGRKRDRHSMHGIVGNTRSSRDKLERPSNGNVVICDDRQMLIEESGKAFKNSETVIGQVSAFDLAKPIVRMRPLVTYKRVFGAQDDTSERQNYRKVQKRGGKR